MFKIIGAAVVIMAAGLIGMGKYNELYERKCILAEIKAGAERILSSLKCMCMPLYECFLGGGDFFKKAAELIADGMLPSDAVKNTVLDVRCITKEERETVMRFADGLCAEDCEGQVRNAELFLSEIERYIESADAELNTKGKLFVKGSLLGATALVLILV